MKTDNIHTNISFMYAQEQKYTITLFRIELNTLTPLILCTRKPKEID